jgi:transposase-like protein
LLEGFDGAAHARATGGHLDEMVVRIAGKGCYLWRAVADEGEVPTFWFSTAATSTRHSG